MSGGGVSPFSIAGKVAVVTGSTMGIGLGIAEALAMAGARVVISSEDAEACGRVATAMAAAGHYAIGIPADVGVLADLHRLVTMATERWGQIDVLVCNAGITGFHGPMEQAPPDEFETVMRVNLGGAYHLCNLVAPGMARSGGGSIILISSISGLRGNTNIGSYALSKAAVTQLARNLSVRWGPKAVRANAISPGLIRTRISEAITRDATGYERRMRMTPLRRMGEVEEVASVAVFLASPAASFVTGQNVVVDGGTVVTD